MQRNNLLPITAKGMVIAMALVGLGLTISAQPLHPDKVPERTGVSNLALLSQSRPRRLPDSHRPFRKGETLRLVYPLSQPAEEVQPYGWRYSEHAPALAHALSNASHRAEPPRQVEITGTPDGAFRLYERDGVSRVVVGDGIGSARPDWKHRCVQGPCRDGEVVH